MLLGCLKHNSFKNIYLYLINILHPKIAHRLRTIHFLVYSNIQLPFQDHHSNFDAPYCKNTETGLFLYLDRSNSDGSKLRKTIIYIIFSQCSKISKMIPYSWGSCAWVGIGFSSYRECHFEITTLCNLSFQFQCR